PKSDVEKAFGVKLSKPAPDTVGLHQPYRQTSGYKAYLLVLGASVGVCALDLSRNKSTKLHAQPFMFDVGAQDPVFSEPFTLEGDRSLEIEAYSFLNNSWVYLQFDLINQDTGSDTTFDLPIEHYSGPDWSEGSSTSIKLLKAV